MKVLNLLKLNEIILNKYRTGNFKQEISKFIETKIIEYFLKEEIIPYARDKVTPSEVENIRHSGFYSSFVKKENIQSIIGEGNTLIGIGLTKLSDGIIKDFFSYKLEIYFCIDEYGEGGMNLLPKENIKIGLEEVLDIRDVSINLGYLLDELGEDTQNNKSVSDLISFLKNDLEMTFDKIEESPYNTFFSPPDKGKEGKTYTKGFFYSTDLLLEYFRTPDRFYNKSTEEFLIDIKFLENIFKSQSTTSIVRGNRQNRGIEATFFYEIQKVKKLDELKEENFSLGFIFYNDKKNYIESELVRNYADSGSFYNIAVRTSPGHINGLDDFSDTEVSEVKNKMESFKIDILIAMGTKDNRKEFVVIRYEHEQEF